LPDDAWHVTDNYTKIREQTLANHLDNGCQTLDVPDRMCDLPIQARAEYTPRPHPTQTSIVSLVKAVPETGYKPHVSTPYLYTGPDVHNPFMELPPGAIDVHAIVSLGRTYNDNDRRQLVEQQVGETNHREIQSSSSTITPGLGWEILDAFPGYCDGTYNSECARDAQNACLLYGHNDRRTGIGFNSYSGWLVMTIPAIEHGIIVVKVEDWHDEKDMTLTRGWTSIDNKGRQLLRGNYYATESPSVASRALKGKHPSLCDNFQFEFAIDGTITKWNLEQYTEKRKILQRTFESLTVLDDPNFTGENVEFAIRMTGCGDSTKVAMTLTHVYFA